MNEIAIQNILQYIEEDLFEPGSNWPDEFFEERSYWRWTANEIINRLMDCPFDAPDSIIASFAMEMNVRATLTDDPKKQHIFSLASEAAETIIFLLP